MKNSNQKEESIHILDSGRIVRIKDHDHPCLPRVTALLQIIWQHQQRASHQDSRLTDGRIHRDDLLRALKNFKDHEQNCPWRSTRKLDDVFRSRELHLKLWLIGLLSGYFSRFSERWQHAREDLELEIFLIT